MSGQLLKGVVAIREGVRGLIVLSLIVVLSVTLFVPTQPGASEVQAGLLTLLGFTARDYFAFKSREDAEKAIERANEPSFD